MMKAFIHGIGVLGPGLIDWPSSIPILRGEHPFDPTQLPHPSPAFLPQMNVDVAARLSNGH